MRHLARWLVGLCIAVLLVLPVGLARKAAPMPLEAHVSKQAPADRTLEAVHAYVAPRLRGVGGRSVPAAVARAVSETLVRAARAAGFDPFFVVAVAEVESRWNVEAVSPTGSQGLMQLQPATFLEVSDSYSAVDPVENVRAGVAYLAALYRGGRGFVHVDSLLRAYSDGPGTAMQYNDAVRANEDLSAFSAQVREYPSRVMARYRSLLRSHGLKHKQPERSWRSP